MNARKSIIFFPYLPPTLGKIDSYLKLVLAWQAPVGLAASTLQLQASL